MANPKTITARMVTTLDNTPISEAHEITVGSTNEVIRRLEYRGMCPARHEVSVQAFVFADGRYLGMGRVDWPVGQGPRVLHDWESATTR